MHVICFSLETYLGQLAFLAVFNAGLSSSELTLVISAASDSLRALELSDQAGVSADDMATTVLEQLHKCANLKVWHEERYAALAKLTKLASSLFRTRINSKYLPPSKCC